MLYVEFEGWVQDLYVCTQVINIKIGVGRSKINKPVKDVAIFNKVKKEKVKI